MIYGFAEELMKIEVKKTDILNGICRDRGKCPVARAIKRKFPDAEFVDVARNLVIIDHKLYNLPKKASRFIGAYDENNNWFHPSPFDKRRPLKGKLKPFSFVLREVKP